MIRSEDGSVSIYFMIVLSVFLLLFTVLADFARIRLAEYHLENALRAAVRSGLSDFDDRLQPYGLFGMRSDHISRDTVHEVLNQHFAYQPGDDAFQLAHVTKEKAEVFIDPSHALSHHEVFKRQILEEMKYKAPIEFSLAVIDKFDRSGARAEMQKATTFYRHIEKLEEMRVKREKELDAAWESVKDWIGADGEIRKYLTFYEERFGHMHQLALKIGNYTDEEVKAIIADLEDLLLSLELAIDVLSARIAAIASSGGELSESQLQTIRSLSERRSQLRREASEVRDQIAEWQDILDAIYEFRDLVSATPSRLAEDSRRLSTAVSRWTEHWKQAKHWNKEIAEMLDRLQQSGEEQDQIPAWREQLLIKPIYFQRLEAGAGTLLTLTENVERRYAPGTFRVGDDFVPVYPQLVEALDTLHAHVTDFYARQAAIEGVRQAQNKDIESEKDEVTGKIGEAIKELKEILYECNDGDREVYIQLKQLEAKYKKGNTEGWEEGDSELSPPQLDDVVNLPHVSMHVLERLQQAFLHIRDDVYINEYTLYYFNYRTYGKNNKPAVHPSSRPDRHILLRQEAEYVLYGFDTCQANHIAATSEIFAVRLGIRTMEALFDPKTKVRAPHPVLVFLYAAYDGAVKAVEDMKQLVAGKEVPLSARLSSSLTLNYKDYLRLFLVLHSREVNQLSRLQALIELNSGQPLENKYTHIEAEIEATVRLWGLPAKQKSIVKTAGWWY
jgi:hypothetical protein